MTAPLDESARFDHGPWLDVDLAALRRNAARYQSRVNVPIMPMVKANGYGLGAVAIARALGPLEPWGYGVASLGEARELREGGIDRPLVAFLPFQPMDAPGYRNLAVRPVIGTAEGLRQWIEAGAEPFHLAVDTGMGRGGFSWRDEGIAELGNTLRNARGYEGIFTHFHSADTDEAATQEQWSRFVAVLARIGAHPPLVHAANSAAGRWGSRFAGSLARPGVFLYGGMAADWRPEPVARLEAKVVAVQPGVAGDTVSYGATKRLDAVGDIVTLGIGYADGVFRSLGNRGEVSIGGQRHPIAGRVTMDMTMVVVPPGTVRVGDHATLFGGPIDLDAQAERAGTISYELLTAVGRRVKRRYGGA